MTPRAPFCQWRESELNAKVNAFALPARDGQLVRGISRDTGVGPVGIFLHGLLSDAEGDKSMALWNQAQKHERSWVRFDMRAHGRSDGTMDEFTISRALEDARLIMNLFPGRPIVLVGSSMGGWVAAELAAERPARIGGAVLIAPAFSFMMQLFHSLNPEQRQLWLSQGSWTFESDGLDYGFTLSYDAVIDSKQYDLLAQTVEFQCPVRILHGRLDDVVPTAQSAEFLSRMTPGANVELDVLPNADHRLSGHVERIIDKTDEIWELIP